jgi:amino acid adenylation domain-containing protein
MSNRLDDEVVNGKGLSNATFKWNDTKADFPSDKCIHQLFEEQVEKRPEAVAVIFEDQQLTYGELNAKANQLAHYLRELGVKPDTLVAICVERSLEMVIGLLGILKAGGAYVPLDPDYPKERLAFMLQDTAALAALTQAYAGKSLPKDGTRTIFLDTQWEHISLLPAENLVSCTLPPSLAYCTYSSGTTGKPNGILTTHAGVVRLVKDINYIKLSPDEVILHAAPLAFDASTFELWGALLNGGRVVVMKPGPLSLESIATSVMRHQVTTMWLTSALFHRYCEQLLSTLNGVQQLLAGGDVLRPDIVKRTVAGLPNCRLINGYGPTETTTFAVCYHIPREFEGDSVPLGNPISNTQVYILDAALKPVPIGVSGEIHIAGAGLARGYLNRPGLTAEKFIPNPFGEAGSRMYKTGDLGRYLPDGNIDFLGRIDHQVKIRGFRIELGEIEAALQNHKEVREAVVMAREDSPGDKRLVSYVVAKERGNISIEALRVHLKKNLPEYMVPSAWVFLERMPLNLNGKIDRKALPAPSMARVDLGVEYVAPRTANEKLLAEIWAEVLKIDRVGIQDRFRALGGSSIQAIDISFKVSRMLGNDLRMPAPLGNVKLADYSVAIEQILEHGKTKALPVILEKQPNDLLLPASYAQQQVFFIEQLGEAWRAYRFHARFNLFGLLDVTALWEALNALVARHEILRTAFFHRSGQLFRRVTTHIEVELPYFDLSHLLQEQQQHELASRLADELNASFDIAQAPLVRWRLIKLSSNQHVLFQSEHHNLHDGQSFRILVRDLAVLYSAKCRGDAVVLPLIQAQYGEYCHEEREWLRSAQYKYQLQEWESRLSGFTEDLRLFTDLKQVAERRFLGEQVRVQVSARLFQRINEVAATLGISRFTLMLSAFGALCSRLCDRERFVIGSSTANRTSACFQWTTGMFVNMVAIPFNAEPSLSFSKFAQVVSEHVDFALICSSVPLSELMKKLGLTASLQGEPPFNIGFSFHDSIKVDTTFHELEVEIEEAVENGSSKFDLSVVGILGNDSISQPMVLRFEYNTDVFDREMIEKIVRYYLVLIEGVLSDPQSQLKDLPLLSEAEREQVLVEWNDTKADFPSDKCIHQLFEEQVEKRPEAVAVIFEDQQLTYGELNAKANQLAHYLRELGVKPDTLVAICVERSLEMVIGLLGILKAGGAYVPLDPDYPKERLAFMLQDTAAPVLLMQEHLKDKLPKHIAREVRLDADWNSLSQHPTTNPDNVTLPQHLAYCIYTSGSTGRPKGAVNMHQGFVNLVHWYFCQELGTQSTERVMLASSLSFDLTQKNVVGILAKGGVLIVPQGTVTDIDSIRSALHKHRPTWVNCTPSAYRVYFESPGTLRTVALGGEQIERGLAEQLLAQGINLINAYGPTECSAVAISHCVGNASLDSNVPLGCPIPNVQIYILDANLNLMPAGIAGEIYIAGIGLSRGYLNHPDLTAEKFIPNPFGKPGSRMYKTGDRGRFLPDGTIDFLGRIDNQVKIRGFRIELGEIERALIKHPDVHEAVVVARDDNSREKYLVGYIVLKIANSLEIEALRTYVQQELPEYMIPSVWVFLKAFPLNPNGKTDRKALPVPDTSWQTQALCADTSTIQEPLSQELRTILDILNELMPGAAVGPNDDLFLKGMHSVLMMRFVYQCKERLNLQIKVRNLYTLASPAAIAEFAKSHKTLS